MRLIDAGALTEQMHNHYEVRNPKQNATMDECCMMVFNAPTIDAVPVVRCKDCEWYDERADFCTFWDSTRHPEHFCGEGERRTDERKAD
jgi:hypothetical protein